jgi:hypothetical protein
MPSFIGFLDQRINVMTELITNVGWPLATKRLRNVIVHQTMFDSDLWKVVREFMKVESARTFEMLEMDPLDPVCVLVVIYNMYMTEFLWSLRPTQAIAPGPQLVKYIDRVWVKLREIPSTVRPIGRTRQYFNKTTQIDPGSVTWGDELTAAVNQRFRTEYLRTSGALLPGIEPPVRLFEETSRLAIMGIGGEAGKAMATLRAVIRVANPNM